MRSDSQFARLLRPYCTVAGLYMLLLAVMKVVEYFIIGIDAPNRLQLLVNAVVYNLVVASWVTLGAGVLYCLVGLRWRRLALTLAAVLYGILLLAESGLTFYSVHNGYLLGCELAARPLGESLLAIKGAVGVALPVALVLLLPGGFAALALWRSHHARRAMTWVVTALCVVMMMLSLVFKVSNLVPSLYSYFILNKTHYLVVDCWQYNSLQHSTGTNKVAYDEEKIATLLSTHPEWGLPSDMHYPLERPTDPDRFLDSHFSPSASVPNIVFILVESLGNEYMDKGIMPFVDSLAATGLYFPNCLSATTRSYGAMPAVTGSLGGPNSFQFGTMPAHNSLLSLLKKAGYNTRAYYAGDFTFDCVYDYLAAQHTDYLSPFYDEFRAAEPDAQGWWWGANDDYLFRRTFEDLEAVRSAGVSPHYSVITTLSMHDRLVLADPQRQKQYDSRAAALANVPARLRPTCSAAIFTDDCLRQFFHDYSRRPDFGNTLFVITGDHSSGRLGGDKLAYHHVPLILWSPLVAQAARYNHVVTHNDIPPALYGLLVSRYGLEPFPTVHWVGDGLSPTPKTLLVVNYAHAICDIVYHNAYYQSDSPFSPEALYTFDSNMLLQPSTDTTLLNACREQLDMMRYLYAYTYIADRLTAHPVYPSQYHTVRIYRPQKAIVCQYPQQPGVYSYTILPGSLMHDPGGYSTLRVTIEADVASSDTLLVLQYPDITTTFQSACKTVQRDAIGKYLPGNKAHISITREFPLDSTADNILAIDLCTPYAEENYRPGICVTLNNTCITIAYGK